MNRYGSIRDFNSVSIFDLFADVNLQPDNCNFLRLSGQLRIIVDADAIVLDKPMKIQLSRHLFFHLAFEPDAVCRNLAGLMIRQNCPILVIILGNQVHRITLPVKGDNQFNAITKRRPHSSGSRIDGFAGEEHDMRGLSNTIAKINIATI